MASRFASLALASCLMLCQAPLSYAADPAPATITLRSTPKTVVRGTISKDRAPVLRIKSGQTVRIDTISHGGLTDDPVAFFAAAGIPKSQVLQDVVDVAALSKQEGFGGHVLTGPIFVEGAAPGDMLEVRILKVQPRVPYGVNNPGPGGVAPGLVAERAAKVIKFDLKRNVALFSKDIEVPLTPFMGIMAVAPSTGSTSSKPPGSYGGNMDMRRLVAGSTLYLPVFHNGALFFTGDSHAAQGDGEVDGNAIEASMTATLTFIVHKGEGKKMALPWAEDAKNFYIMGMDPDLDLAAKSAVTETVGFLVSHMGMTPSDAYSLTSVGIDFSIAEAVDQNLTIYGTIPKSHFKKAFPYWGKK